MDNHPERCQNVCHSHEDMIKWREKVDECIYDSKNGLLVNMTRLVEGFSTVQRVVYGAVAVAGLALATSVIKMVMLP